MTYSRVMMQESYISVIGKIFETLFIRLMRQETIHIEGKGRSINARAMKIVQVYVISPFIREGFHVIGITRVVNETKVFSYLYVLL